MNKNVDVAQYFARYLQNCVNKSGEEIYIYIK